MARIKGTLTILRGGKTVAYAPGHPDYETVKELRAKGAKEWPGDAPQAAPPVQAPAEPLHVLAARAVEALARLTAAEERLRAATAEVAEASTAVQSCAATLHAAGIPSFARAGILYRVTPHNVSPLSVANADDPETGSPPSPPPTREKKKK